MRLRMSRRQQEKSFNANAEPSIIRSVSKCSVFHMGVQSQFVLDCCVFEVIRDKISEFGKGGFSVTKLSHYFSSHMRICYRAFGRSLLPAAFSKVLCAAGTKQQCGN